MPGPDPTRFSKMDRISPNSLPLKQNLLIIFWVLIFYALFIYKIALFDDRRFGIIIDGGSTGTRIHVFQFRVQSGLPQFDFGPNGLSSFRVNPGLSSFKHDPGRAGGSLIELLEFGKKRVPNGYWEKTEIRLMATAGLRLLDGDVQEKILESCRSVLRVSGFKFRDDWAKVISGSDEGLYAWIVANYALGTLGRDPHRTTGIIELGGASAQVTFVLRKSAPSEFSHTLKYGNVTYNLYSNSLLHFGQNVAFDSLNELLVSSGVKLATGSPMSTATLDPCTPKGYAHNANSFRRLLDSSALKYSSSFHAMGNFSECRAAALALLQKGKEDCSHDHCTLGATFMPKLPGRFLATENFFHTSQFFGLAPKAHLSDLMVAGRQFCEEDWSNIRRKHSSRREEDLLHYCFSSAYIVALLHDSLGIGLNDGRVRYTNRVKNTPLDWALGAFILQSTDGISIDGGNRGWVASAINSDFPTLLLLVGAAILSISVVWYVFPWKNFISKLFMIWRKDGTLSHEFVDDMIFMSMNQKPSKYKGSIYPFALAAHSDGRKP